MTMPRLMREEGRGPPGSDGTASSPDNIRIPVNTPGTLALNDAWDITRTRDLVAARGHKKQQPKKTKKCWYKLIDLKKWYYRRCEWAAGLSDLNYQRIAMLEISTRGFHVGLKILEHWDTRWKQDVYFIRARKTHDTTLGNMIDKDPKRPFKYLWEFALDGKEQTFDGWVRSLIPGVAGQRYTEPDDLGGGKESKSDFGYKISDTGMKILKEVYLHVERMAKQQARMKNEDLGWLEDWKRKLTDAELPYQVKF